MAAATESAFDVEAFAVRVAQIAAEHDTRSALEAARRTRDAFQRWGSRCPAGVARQAAVADLVHEHRAYWVGSAANHVRSLDPEWLVGRQFHVVDTSAIGLAREGEAGFFMPGLFDILRPHLPVSAVPGPVVGVNVASQAARDLERLDGDETACIRETVRVGLQATVLHEAAHAIEMEHAGRRMPAGATLDHVRTVVMDRPQSTPARDEVHGPEWVRAFAHLAFRATIFPPSNFWPEVFSFDVSQHHSVNGDDVLDALATEFASVGRDEPIIDILRRPAPPAFSRLFGTAAPMTQGTNHAGNCKPV